MARVRAQLERYEWYRRIFERYRTQVDELLHEAPDIPIRKGRAFYESCPDDDAVLTFDPYAPQRHSCPKCGKNWTGEKFDGGWVRQFQDWLAKRLVEAGIVYRVSGGEHYAAFIRACLRHYADHYREYPLESNLLGPTRLFQSTYLESFWLTDLVTAYDLVRAAPCYSDEDHAAIRDLFY
ncbi:MAG TPA: hypothetical protein VF171_07055, partial [Trueperaceae bacterium]